MCTEANLRETTPPALFMDRESWEELPEKLEDPFFRRLHESNLEALERLADVDEPDTQRRRLKNRLERAVVAWYLTRQQRYLRMAIEALELTCREDEQWRVTDDSIEMIRCANLATGELLYNAAFGYDALHPYLPDSLKRECVDAIVEKGLAAYLEGLRLEDWWVKCDFNWNSALHGNAGLAALTVRNEAPDLAERVLDEALCGLPYMIGNFPRGGGWIEGAMYCCTAMGHLTDFVVAYHRLTGKDLDLLKNRNFHDTITWLTCMQGGDGRTYNFSDAHAGRGGVALPHLFWWARILDRPDWAHALERHAHHGPASRSLFHDVAAFWYREPFQPTRPPERKPLRHFEGLDWLTWRGDRTWLAFRSGFNGGNHDNDDLGNFILGAGDERFLCDPGYGTYEASRHNCITVRRFEQTDCATARITRLEEFDGGFYLCCDIQEAFPHVTRHYDRHLLLADDEHLLLVDDVLGTDDIRTTVRSHLQTRLPCRETDEGWLIEGERNALRVINLSPAGWKRSDRWQPGRRHQHSITCLSWKRDYDRVHTVHATLLTFGDTDYEYSEDDAGLQVCIDGTTCRFAHRADGRLGFGGA